MAFYDDLFKGGNLVTGVALGLGVAIVAPVAMTLIRPLAKGVIRVGLLAYNQAAAGIADLSEGTQDLIAEVQQERQAENTEPPVSGRTETPTSSMTTGSPYSGSRETAPGTA